MKKLALGFLALMSTAALFAAWPNGGGGGGVAGSGDITSVTAGTNLSGGGTSGGVTLDLANTVSLSGSSFSVGTATFVVTGGKVGIGTTTPAQALDVVGNFNVSGSVTGGAAGAGPIQFVVGGSTYSFGGSSTTINGLLSAGTTNTITVSISTDPVNGFTSRAEPFVQVPTGRTWTITKAYATALPSGTSVQFNLDERTSAGLGSAGTDVFTVSNTTATVGSNNITSFANASIAADAWLVVKTPATGASAGGANRLIFTIFYNEQ